MDTYKYQILVIILAVALGAAAGYLLSSNNSDKELKREVERHITELKRQADSTKKEIQKRDIAIHKLDSLSRQDSLRYITLQISVKQDGVKTEVKRQQAAKFTENEQTQFLLRRYAH